VFVGLFVLGGLFLVLSGLFFALTIVYITLLVAIIFGIEQFHFRSIGFFFLRFLSFFYYWQMVIWLRSCFFGQLKSRVDFDPENAIFIPAGINLGLEV
jgi:hypothetical protein